MMSFLISVALVAVLIDVIALVCWKAPVPKRSPDEIPPISILIPMRNEAHNVKGLIESLRKLNYPDSKVEVLIGEDRSNDNTAELLKDTVGSDPRFKIIPISLDFQNLKAKANVVAQLIPHCTSQFYFITDADVRVPPNWVVTMLSNLSPKDGVIGGATVVKVSNLWTGLQNIDWLLAQGLLFVTGKYFPAIAVSGTNMMIPKDAIEAIGGYDKIPYSLTEDIGLLTAVKRKGFSASIVLDPNAMTVIAGQPNWATLVSQRARWTYGALRLPVIVVLLLLIRSLFLLLLLTIAWWEPALAVLLYAIKTLIDLIFIHRVAKVLKQKISIGHFLCFEVYWMLVSTSGLLKHLFSPKTKWKGRSY